MRTFIRSVQLKRILKNEFNRGELELKGVDPTAIPQQSHTNVCTGTNLSLTSSFTPDVSFRA